MKINKLLPKAGYHISYSSKKSFNFGLVIVIITFEKNISYSFSYS